MPSIQCDNHLSMSLLSNLKKYKLQYWNVLYIHCSNRYVSCSVWLFWHYSEWCDIYPISHFLSLVRYVRVCFPLLIRQIMAQIIYRLWAKWDCRLCLQIMGHIHSITLSDRWEIIRRVSQKQLPPHLSRYMISNLEPTTGLMTDGSRWGRFKQSYWWFYMF